LIYRNKTQQHINPTLFIWSKYVLATWYPTVLIYCYSRCKKLGSLEK